MALMKRAVDAGPLHLEFLYPVARPRDPDQVRAGKRRLTGLAQARMNAMYSTLRLACLMAANFSPGDHALILTFDGEHLPGSRADALRLWGNFCRGLKAARARRGAKLLALASLEHQHGDGRWHVHMLVNDAGDLEDIRRRWKYGRVFAQPFRMGKTKNCLSLARYYCKERRDRVGQRRWLFRGELKKPEAQSWRVPDRSALRAPTGAVVIERSDNETEYGRSQFLFYMDRDGLARRKRRPPKRRKRSVKSRP